MVTPSTSGKKEQTVMEIAADNSHSGVPCKSRLSRTEAFRAIRTICSPAGVISIVGSAASAPTVRSRALVSSRAGPAMISSISRAAESPSEMEISRNSGKSHSPFWEGKYNTAQR